MQKPIVVEMFADNGEHSHWELINADTGETLWQPLDDSQNSVKLPVSGRSEQLPQLDDETVLEPMQNALYASNRFTTDQCSTLAEGILMYLKDAKMRVVPCGNCH